MFAGDIRLHHAINEQDTDSLAWPVSLEYNPGERLLFNSDFMYAGARIYGFDLFDIAAYGLDVRHRMFVR